MLMGYLSPSELVWDWLQNLIMRKTIASLVLLVFLAGISAPAALALVPASPHECCHRKEPHCHHSGELSFNARATCQRDCCSSITASQSAQPSPSISYLHSELVQRLPKLQAEIRSQSPTSGSRSVRAPPLSSQFA